MESAGLIQLSRFDITALTVTLDIPRLFDTHGAFVARAIERLVGRGPRVDDLLQETFIVAFKKAHRFDPGRAQASTWLYGIAINLCRRFERGQRRAGFLRERLAAHTAVVAAETGPDHVLEREEAIRMVQRAIGKLPFKQREVFVLFELEGLGGREIGALLGVKEGTVWTRLHHARKAFEKNVRKRTGYDG
jgi:RNA polymerase sigma-70 factor (ECF subfamily)